MKRGQISIRPDPALKMAVGVSVATASVRTAPQAWDAVVTEIDKHFYNRVVVLDSGRLE